jgi:hypothetical protein
MRRSETSPTTPKFDAWFAMEVTKPLLSAAHSSARMKQMRRRSYTLVLVISLAPSPRA